MLELKEKQVVKLTIEYTFEVNEPTMKAAEDSVFDLYWQWTEKHVASVAKQKVVLINGVKVVDP